MSAFNLFATATAMRAALRAKEISAVALLDLHVRRITRYNPHVKAIVSPDYDRARQTAEAADAARARGEDRPLLGLPMTVKEVIDVAGLPTTAGLPARAAAIAPADALHSWRKSSVASNHHLDSTMRSGPTPRTAAIGDRSTAPLARRVACRAAPSLHGSYRTSAAHSRYHVGRANDLAEGKSG